MNVPSPTIRVQAHDFDLQAEVDALSGGRTDIGAIVSFVGLCRSEQGKLSALELEHYPGMAEMEMKRIADLAIERFSLMGATAIHRHGRIEPGQNIVLVIATAPHRQAAFDGANFIMDYLKRPRASMTRRRTSGTEFHLRQIVIRSRRLRTRSRTSPEITARSRQKIGP